MAPNIHIRDVEASDRVALEHLFRGQGFDHLIDEACQQMSQITTRLLNPAAVATEDGRIIGLVALHVAPTIFFPERIARVTALYVDEVERRRGVGRLLVEVAVSRAFQARCDTLELGADLEREDCREFFAAASFEQVSIFVSRRLFG